MMKSPDSKARSKDKREEEYLKAVGARVYSARKAQRLSAREVSNKIGCSSTWIYSVESGIQNFSISMLLKLAAALGIEIETLLSSVRHERELLQMKRLIDLSRKALSAHGAAGLALSEIQSILSDIVEPD